MPKHKMTTTNISITTPGILFSTVSLIMLAYTNRFLAITSVIRSLSENYSRKPDKHLLVQIQLLKKRAILIKAIQMLCILALLLSIVTMLLILYNLKLASIILFSSSLVFLLASLAFAVYEVALSTNALTLSLSAIEKPKTELE
jgi:hypothetical protein